MPSQSDSAEQYYKYGIVTTPEQVPIAVADETQYALLAEAAYDPSKASPDLQGYGWQQAYTDKDRVIYERTLPDGTKQAALATSGTRLNKGLGTLARDLYNDTLLAVGLQNKSKRFKDTNKLAQQLTDQYGKDNVFLVGHSLGGTQAATAAKKTGAQAYVYNMGSTALTGMSFGTKQYGNIHAYHSEAKAPIVGKDPLSSGSYAPRFDDHVVKKKKGTSVHSLANFI